MGIALAIVIGFLGVVGFSQKIAVTQKHLKQVQINKKVVHAKTRKAEKTISMLDGVEIRNLKG